MVLSLIVIRNKGCSNLLRVFIDTFCRGNKPFLKYGIMSIQYPNNVDSRCIFYICIILQENNFYTESSFPNCSFKTGLGFEAMLSTYICMHKIIYNVKPRKLLYVYIRAQNVVLHCLTLSSFTCLLWYDLFGV